MAALDSMKVPAEPADLFSSDGEDEQSGDLDLGRAMTMLRVSVGEPADGDDDDDDDGAGPSRVASIAAPSISTKVREVGLYKRTAQDAAAVQRLGGGAGEADDAAAAMLAMGLALNHRGWVLKMGGTRLGALQTGAVWHKRWALVEALAAAEAETKASYVSPAIDGDDGEDHREHPAPSLVDLEFAYATAMALENPKNYQVWNHMRLVSQHLGDVSVERNVRATGEALALDAKNIHAWTHRLWVVRTFPKMMRDAERAFTEKMIDDDVRNNSAWNQRFAVTFLTSSSDDDVIDEDTDLVSKELAFAETKIAIAPDNESAWNYLRGVADLPAARDDDAIKTRLKNVARTFCGDAISEQSDDSEEKDGVVQGVDATAPSKRRVARDTRATTRTTSTGTKKESREKNFSRHATALLADVLAASGAREDAAALYGRLVHRDPIRANYWTFMRDDARRRRG